MLVMLVVAWVENVGVGDAGALEAREVTAAN